MIARGGLRGRGRGAGGSRGAGGTRHYSSYGTGRGYNYFTKRAPEVSKVF